MGGSVRSKVLVGFGAAVFALGSATVAWACTAQSGISGSAVKGQSSGAAGSQITVSVTNFPPDPISIHWNSVDGERLATGRGPDFSTSITIPQVAEGVYYVVASGGQPGREQRASMSVEVTSGTAQQSGTGSRSTSQVSTGTGQNTAATSGDEQPATSGGQTSTNRGGAVSSGPSGTSVADSSSGSTANAEPAGRAAGTGTTAASASTERQPGAATAIASSAPSASAPLGAQQSLAAPAADAGTSAPDAVAGSTASGDLWSGFSTGDGTTPRGAGLTDDSSPAGTSSSLVAVGAFSVALVAMFGGFLTAEVRRRRVLAR